MSLNGRVIPSESGRPTYQAFLEARAWRVNDLWDAEQTEQRRLDTKSQRQKPVDKNLSKRSENESDFSGKSLESQTWSLVNIRCFDSGKISSRDSTRVWSLRQKSTSTFFLLSDARAPVRGHVNTAAVTAAQHSTHLGV